MRIRKFRSNDNKKISYVIRKCLVHVNNADYTDQQIKFLCREFSPAKITARFLNRDSFVATQDDKILGCVTFSEGEISSLFVNPKFHSQGIGHKLMQKAEMHARKCGFSKTWVNSSKTAITFYENLQYIKKKRISHKEGGVTVVMEKVLHAE